MIFNSTLSKLLCKSHCHKTEAEDRPQKQHSKADRHTCEKCIMEKKNTYMCISKWIIPLGVRYIFPQTKPIKIYFTNLFK